MQLVKMFKFALHSVTAGLALAFVVLVLNPEWILGIAGPTTAARGKQDDVVSYSRAVAIATPAVVNIYTAKAVTSLPSPLVNDPLFKRYFADTRPATLGGAIVVAIPSVAGCDRSTCMAYGRNLLRVL